MTVNRSFDLHQNNPIERPRLQQCREDTPHTTRVRQLEGWRIHPNSYQQPLLGYCQPLRCSPVPSHQDDPQRPSVAILSRGAVQCTVIGSWCRGVGAGSRAADAADSLDFSPFPLRSTLSVTAFSPQPIHVFPSHVSLLLSPPNLYTPLYTPIPTVHMHLSSLPSIQVHNSLLNRFPHSLHSWTTLLTLMG